MHKWSHGGSLLPDRPQLLRRLLADESDASAECTDVLSRRDCHRCSEETSAASAGSATSSSCRITTGSAPASADFGCHYHRGCTPEAGVDEIVTYNISRLIINDCL